MAAGDDRRVKGVGEKGVADKGVGDKGGSEAGGSIRLARAGSAARHRQREADSFERHPAVSRISGAAKEFR